MYWENLVELVAASYSNYVGPDSLQHAASIIAEEAHQEVKFITTELNRRARGNRTIQTGML
jgi:hypothetical protein